MTGLDAPVADYVAQDPSYEGILGQIETLLVSLIPLYAREGWS